MSCTWCGEPATHDKYGPACLECFNAPRLVRVRRYIKRLRRGRE